MVPSMLPPVTSSRPSGRNVCPLQKMRYDLLTGVKCAWSAGSQSSASPRSPQSNTFAVRSRCMWTATTGVENVAAHLPFVATRPEPAPNAAVNVRAWIAVW